MVRLKRIPIPNVIKEQGRTREILGDTKNNTMVNCVYNDIIANGPWEDVRLTTQQVKDIIDKLQLTIKSDFLKDYQIEDLRKSLMTNNVFNINKPGYGKTLETIIWLKNKYMQDGPLKILVLCPKSVIETWMNQLNRYWPNCMSDCTYWITNYEQLYNDDNFNTALSFTWDVIVLDESHKIKSMKSKINDKVFQLKSRYRQCLTGTPVKNRPQDLAAQLKWLDESSITNFTDFQFAFCDMIRDNWGWHPNGLTKNKTMIANLQNLLDVYCVGGKEHNSGLIDKPEYIKVRLKMDDKVKKLYRKVEGEWNEELQANVIDTEYLLEQGIKVTSSIEAATRRQQLASNPQLFNEQLKNVKFEWILDWLDGTDEKVIIFSKFAKTIEQLDKLLRSKKYKVTTIQQKMTAAQRQLNYQNWKKNNQVLLTTFGLTKEGVDGLQEACNYIIFVDREWTASDNEQAEGRIFRMGQTKQPIFYILQCIGTIDIRIERIQLDKGHDARELLEPVSDYEE